MDLMRRVSGVALFAAALASGCAQNEEALIVTHSPGFSSYDCFADPQGDVTLQRGTHDLLYGTPYTLPVALLNNLSSRPSGSTNTGIENGELQLRDVDVRLSMEQSPEVIDAVRAQNPAFVEFSTTLASNSLQPGTDVGVLVDVISDGAARALRDAVTSTLGDGARPILTAELIFHATRTGNSAGSIGVIDSRPYTFPIMLCSGCLPVSCESCPDSQCPPDPTFVGPCGNAQDGLLYPAQCAAPQL